MATDSQGPSERLALLRAQKLRGNVDMQLRTPHPNISPKKDEPQYLSVSISSSLSCKTVLLDCAMVSRNTTAIVIPVET